MPIRQEGSVEAGYGIDEMAAGGGLLGLIPWYPIAAEPPLFLSRQSAWVGHIPFAFWSVAALRPDVFVELGTMAGDSYLAFCQAIEALSLPTCAHAVDHWKGDEQAGFYGDQLYEEFKRRHDGHYSRFSSLLRMDFDEAASLFPEESIDLLHIDGCHRYEVVRKDFFRWLPKLSRRAVVLLHDVAEWRSDFGVWRLWNELRAGYPSFLFPHAHGLGVILAGPEAPEAFQALASLSGERAARVRRWFRRLGERVAADPRAGEEPKGGGGLPGERQVQDAVLEEPAAILEKMRRDPVWRFLGWTRLRSQRSGQLLTQACALARELSEEGLSNASRRSILEDLTEAAERHLRSRSFRTLARFGAIFRPLRREKAEEEGERLRDALWRSFRLLVRAIGAEEALPWRDSLGFPLERDADKMALRERYRKALEEFLLGSDRLPLPSASEPELSVVVVLYNQAELTYACLRSLAIHLDPAA
ncbi:MAG: class I SAM-dependent methyltransferase, partial [Candidatus Methylacidiphilaceae bacterium]